MCHHDTLTKIYSHLQDGGYIQIGKLQTNDPKLIESFILAGYSLNDMQVIDIPQWIADIPTPAQYS